MSVVDTVKRVVPESCQKQRCSKDRCSVLLAGVPQPRVVVDMDCDALGIPGDAVRCDYVVVSGSDQTLRIVPIEMKSGRVNNGRAVVGQLQAGADFAQRWARNWGTARLVPVLAHGKGVGKLALKELRGARISFRGTRLRPQLVRCGERIAGLLGEKVA